MSNSLQDEIRKVIRMKGRVAFRNGETLEQNPYTGTDEALSDWRAGWLEAQTEIQDARN